MWVIGDLFTQKLDKAATAVDDSDRMRKVLNGNTAKIKRIKGFGEPGHAR